MRKIFFSVLMLMLLMTIISNVHAQTPQEILAQYISNLQNNPNDNALREKIIKHVQTMSHAPKIPAEVDELVGQAKYVFKHAKGQKDYLDAVEAYKKVVTIAPWVGDYYYNLGVAQEQADLPQDAIKSFNLYLMASPDAKDARDVRERIGGLKYAAKMADRVPSQPPVAEVKRDPFENLLRKIDGRRYVHRDPDTRITNILDIKGRTLICGYIIEPGSPASGPRDIYMETERYEIYGRVVEGPVVSSQEISTQVIFTISESGEKIHQEFWLGSRGKGRKGREYDFFWKR